MSAYHNENMDANKPTQNVTIPEIRYTLFSISNESESIDDRKAGKIDKGPTTKIRRELLT